MNLCTVRFTISRKSILKLWGCGVNWVISEWVGFQKHLENGNGKIELCIHANRRTLFVVLCEIYKSIRICQ